MADLNVLNTTADLTGKTLVTAEGDRTISGLWTFNRGAGAPPIAVAAGAGAVANFDADLLDGVQGVGYSRAPNVLTTVAVGAQHNLAPGTLRNGINILRCNNATALTLSGLDGGAEGMVLVVLSVGAGQVNFTHEDAGSDAENRFLNFATVGQTSLAAGSGTAAFYYDGTTQRWRLFHHEQGAWISPPYNAGDFYGGGAMTWGVDAEDVMAYQYRLSGRTCVVSIEVYSSDVGGTPDPALKVLIPAGLRSAESAAAFARCKNAAATYEFGYCRVTPAGVAVEFRLGSNAVWSTTSGDNTFVQGQITFEVQ